MEPKPTPPPAADKPTPVMDVVTAPPEAPRPAESAPAPAAKPDPAKHDPPKPTRPRQPKNGVGMAIFATMIIVVVLATLATYAYLQSRK